MPIELPVVTAAGSHRTVTLQLELNGSAWYTIVEQTCVAIR